MRCTEAFNVDTATRENILNRSLRKSQPSNRNIRQALGWRETTEPCARRPKFKSHAVLALFDKLHLLAKRHLLLSGRKELEDVWMNNSPITAEIEKLVDEYGEEIWGDPMNKRDRASNPVSHLLVANQNHLYTTDLFIELDHHRK
jgi:hypothetical protein